MDGPAGVIGDVWIFGERSQLTFISGEIGIWPPALKDLAGPLLLRL
jgi:hypothetical protein